MVSERARLRCAWQRFKFAPATCHPGERVAAEWRLFYLPRGRDTAATATAWRLNRSKWCSAGMIAKQKKNYIHPLPEQTGNHFSELHHSPRRRSRNTQTSDVSQFIVSRINTWSNLLKLQFILLKLSKELRCIFSNYLLMSRKVQLAIERLIQLINQIH
jgi:hypothetical protein